MIRLLNVSLVLTVLASAFVLYTLEHSTRATERRIVQIESDIKQEEEAIKLLKAEWSNLTRPARLQALAELRLGLKPIMPTQMVTAAELAQRIPEKPPDAPDNQTSDPIADILKRME
jgi:cell division protein FtsL